jgi:K+ transporter
MGPTIRERRFWRVVAATLGLLLSVLVLANLVRAETVPSQVTLLLFGTLVAIGIGNAIVNPRSSPVVLAEHKEARLRLRHHAFAFAVSLILIVLLMLTEQHSSALAFLFSPIIALPFVLLLRARLNRGKVSRPGNSNGKVSP